MSPTARSRPRTIPQRTIRLGFIALNDAAPLVVAREQGFFRRHGLSVALSREVGWATIRDKIIYGELDAAHAPGPMVIGTTLGLNCPPCPCLTALVLSVNGNAITLSNELRELGVRDSKTMAREVARRRGDRIFLLGVVFSHSSHQFHLCDWLSGAGVEPGHEVRIVVVPPPQLFRNLAAGTIDGYCAGEPWNSLAVIEGAGWCPATSLDLAPGHVEKVLMVRADFAERRKREHLSLVAALHEAAELCDDPDFRPELARLLSRREYLNVPEPVIAAGLVGPFGDGCGRTIPGADFIQFHRDGVSDPTPAKAAWLLDKLIRHGLVPAGTDLPRDLAEQTFRTDLFHQACNHAHTTATV